MARIPNEEQSLAISATGGLLLSAGAGSGKTFVIIEHLIVHIQQSLAGTPFDQLEIKVSECLDKIALMTFTKKASGEMLVRLINKLEEKKQENEILWSLVLKHITRVKISTIHGFCHSLISEGHWTHYPLSFELLNSTLHFNKIQTLFNKWYILNNHKLSDQLLAHTSDLQKGIFEIFASPELRLMWKSAKNINSAEEHLNDFFGQLIEIYQLNELFEKLDLLNFDNEQLKKTVFKLLDDFINIVRINGQISGHNYQIYYEFLMSIARFPSANKEMSEIEKNYRLCIQSLREFLKANYQNLISFQQNFERFKEWREVLVNIFNFIDEHYLDEPGLSFSDLEYYVAIGLSTDSIKDKISKQFDLIIVDEFQDTSPIQFEIIKNSLNGNLNKLFCVGDKKQAIYGFRGGELGVFEECSRMLGPKKNLSLKTNYRSLKKVIDFNNSFFNLILPLGNGFEDLDRHSVTMEHQLAPEKSQDGEIEKINLVSSFNEEDFDFDHIEAFGILQSIKRILEDDNIKNIAILYRRLAPSKKLIDLLKDEKLDFVAQIKIDIDEDPIFSLFKLSLSYHLNRDNPQKKLITMQYFKSFSEMFFIDANWEVELERFSSDLKIFGLEISFQKFLFALNISNSLFMENLNLISSLIKIADGNLLQVYNMLEVQDVNYSFELINGTKKKIIIQTVHASKGLEYDCVILGGIHNNGRYEGMKDKVGKLPNSFRWKADFNQKEFYKTPTYILETILTGMKEFSESKRLLYVACTRAIKKLVFMNIINNGEEKINVKNSWVNALRLFNSFSYKLTEVEIPKDLIQKNELNLSFKDQMGILNTHHQTQLGIISELSVTRLAVLVDCPFKFYLKNICKIDNKSLSFFEDEESEFQEKEFKSSLKRGTFIHEQISNRINNIKNSKMSHEDLQKVDWVVDEIQKNSLAQVISEREIKFSFMGQMITAIPDLVLKSNSSQIEIWDFKTGNQDKGKENSYWFQLMVYAFGYALIDNLPQEFEFKLKLIYVDLKIIEDKIIKLKDLEQLIKIEWNKIDNFNQINKSHCPSCEFNKICVHCF